MFSQASSGGIAGKQPQLEIDSSAIQSSKHNSLVAQGHEQFKQLQQQLSTVLKQAHKRTVTRMNSLQQQMGSSEQCQALQKQADMLMANIYRYAVLATMNTFCRLTYLLPHLSKGQSQTKGKVKLRAKSS